MTEPTVPFYPELLDRYSEMCAKCTANIPYGIQPDKTQLWHIKGMLEILRTDNTQSITKKHRWLGFIQGVLIMQGVTTVDAERDFTRNLFNGD